MASLFLGSPLRKVSEFAIAGHLVGVTGWDQAGTSPVNTPMRTFGRRSIRIWDCGVTWRLIETSKGVFDWSRLDAEMAIWDDGFTDILFCLGQAPDWAAAAGSGSYNPNPPSSTVDSADFVTALLTRYPTLHLEHWNEPDNTTFWNGTPAQLAAITVAQANAAKAINPNVVLLSAAPQSFGDRGDTLRQYLKALNTISGQSAINVISFHTYVMPRQPEYMGYMIDLVRAVMVECGYDLPMWSTEFGWGGIPSAPGGAGFYDDVTGAYVNTTGATMSETQGASYLVRGYLVSLAKGLERQYFYADDKLFSAIRLFDYSAKGTILRPGNALSYLAATLGGGWIGEVEQFGQLFSVEIVSAGGKQGRVFWALDMKTQVFDLTEFDEIRDAVGTLTTAPSATYSITNAPVYAFKS